MQNIVHELRNSLGALRAAQRLLERADEDPGLTSLAHETIARQIAHMSHLIDRLDEETDESRGRAAREQGGQ